MHPTRFAYDGDADPSQPGGIAEIYRALVADEERLKQIVTDVLDAHQAGANILVLTTWVDHVDALTEHLTAAGCEDIIVLRGGMKARERQAVIESIATRVASGSPLLLVGTGSYIGEGFDCPALDTLFLAAPVSFKGRLVQYAGRITRAHPGKTTATVHDYHDVLTPVIASSLRKRAPGYAELGFPDPRKLGN
ncbi:DEAD/DEAH box helicase [Nocardia niigatensis]